MKVIAVSDVFIDGWRGTHCGVLFCKKSGDNSDKETWSISLPEEDGTSKIVFNTEDVKKVFLYSEKHIIALVSCFSPT